MAKSVDLVFITCFTSSLSLSPSSLLPPLLFLDLFLSSLTISATRVAMEERKRNLVLILGLYMCVYMLVKHVVDMQVLVLQREWEKLAIFSIFFKSMGRIEHSIWSKISLFGFIDQLLSGPFTKKEFKSQARVTFGTFRFLYEKLDPFLVKKNTKYRSPIFVENKLAMSLQRLGISDGLQVIGDLYRVAECTVSMIVRDFCRIIRMHL